MKENVFYSIDNDLNVIECTLTIAEVTIEEAKDGKFTVVYPNASNVRIGNNNEELVVFQDKRTLFTRAPQNLKSSFPDIPFPQSGLTAKTSV